MATANCSIYFPIVLQRMTAMSWIDGQIAIPFNPQYVDAIVAYVSYFGSRFVGNDLQVLCGNVFDHPIAKTFTLFCIMYQASKSVKVATVMTTFFLFFQFILSRNRDCSPYRDKTSAQSLDTRNYFWPRNLDIPRSQATWTPPSQNGFVPLVMEPAL